MLALVAVLHIFIAIFLIILVLIQDSKGGGAAGVLGSSGSNSLLGATGATTLLEKLTRYMAIGFGLSCICLTVLTAQSTGSVVDSYIPPAAPVKAPADTAAKPAENAAPAEQTGQNSAPAAAPADKAAPAAAQPSEPQKK